MPKTRLLVIDDEANIQKSLSQVLGDEGYEVRVAGSVAAGLEAVEREQPGLVLLDVRLPDGSGVDALKQLRERWPEVEVVMISGHATVDLAVEAIRCGAYDFLEKPLVLERVLLTVERALERGILAADIRRRDAAEAERFRMVGESGRMKQLRLEVEQFAPTQARVLITGETGTGKELVAFWLHYLSQRRDRPFVRINCAAIPRDLLESELFGYEKGAFTGAVSRKPGKLELAHTGTVFLDEIGDMDAVLQAKLLRALETGEFEALGSNRPLKVDIRVLAATNKNLAEAIRKGTFREDLYHRLNVVSIRVPALRERPEDIPVLAEHFLQGYCRENGMPEKRLAADAPAVLKAMPFTGNVRELKNLVERAAIVAQGGEISAAVLIQGASETAAGESSLFTRTRPLAEARDELEKLFLERQMVRFGWLITKAAAELKVERSVLSRRLKELGLRRPGAGNEE